MIRLRHLVISMIALTACRGAIGQTAPTSRPFAELEQAAGGKGGWVLDHQAKAALFRKERARLADEAEAAIIEEPGSTRDN